MEFTSRYLVLVYLLSIISFSCSENNITQPEEYLIHRPAKGAIIYTLTSYMITWNPAGWPAVNIALVNPSGDSWPIGKELPNVGSSLWEIPDPLSVIWISTALS